MDVWQYQLITGAHLHGWWVRTSDKGSDGIMIISVKVPMLTNYLGMPLIYLTAVCFFADSEGVYVNAKLRIMWFGSLFYHQRANHGALSRPSRLPHISILSFLLCSFLLVNWYSRHRRSCAIFDDAVWLYAGHVEAAGQGIRLLPGFHDSFVDFLVLLYVFGRRW